LEGKLVYSDTAVIGNKILNNEIDKLEKELEQIYKQKAKGAQIGSREKLRLSYLDSLYNLKLNYLSSKNPYLFLVHLTRNLRIHFDDLYI
jgi:hypothetical protein